MCSKAPDMSGANAAALQQAKLSGEQLAWAKQIYGETAPDRAAATARANTVSDAQLSALTKQTALTDDYANYNKTTFRPLEQGIVDGANSFDTEAQRELAAGKAGADVNQGFSLAQGTMNRNLARRGVNPASGAALAAGSEMATQQALGLAGASNKARADATTLGYARKMDAANIGRGLASSQATSAGLALNQGNSAASNGAMSGNINAQGNQIMTQGYAGAQQGLAGAANTYGNIANIEQRAGDNSALLGAVGSVAGKFVMSDKNMKKGRKPVASKNSLAAIRKMPINSWQYKAGTAGDDGGKTHVGPMAQDVRKGLGDATAPGGKKIDIISMQGHTLNAIKAVDKRLMRLENATNKQKATS